MKNVIRLLVVAGLTSGLPQIGRAEHPIGPPALVSEQRAAGETAPLRTDPAIQGSDLGGATVQGANTRQDAAGGASDPVPEAAQVNPLSRMALGELQAFKGRPLFAPSRRPPDLPAPAPVLIEAAPVSEMSPPPDVRLIGIVAGVDKAVAVLGGPAGGPPISVRIGDMVETWRVALIAPDRVVLRQGEREQAYRIFASASAAIRAPSEMRKGEASTAQPELKR